MAKLTALIPNQRFEIIRDRIGEILAEELANQEALDGPVAPAVYVSRAIPPDETDYPMINISLTKGDYSGKTQSQADGNYVYNIDVYTASPTTPEGRGDQLAAQKLQRYVGMIRAILENPVYRTLDYAPPFMCEGYVSGFEIADPQALLQDSDAQNSTVGRLQYAVRVPEYVQLKTAPPIAANLTGVKLELTDKGYLYVDTWVAHRRYVAQNGGRFTTEQGDYLIPQN